MSRQSNENGQTLVASAFVIPILLMLIIGGIIFGLASVEDFRLERATSDAALLSESEGRQVIRSVNGRVLCWWEGSGSGGCFDDGLILERTQIVAEGRIWTYPTGQFTPIAHVSRPKETTTTTEGIEP